jgi:hypothetical protein
MKIFKQLFCDHNYELINQFVQPSEFDIVVQNKKIPNTHCSLKRLTVTDYKCAKCNKLQRRIVETPS